MRMPRAHPLPHLLPPTLATAPCPGDASQGCYSTHGRYCQENRALAAGWAVKSVPGGWWKPPLALRKPWEGVFAHGWLLSVWEVTPKPSSLPGCSLDSMEILFSCAGRAGPALPHKDAPGGPAGLIQSSRAPAGLLQPGAHSLGIWYSFFGNFSLHREVPQHPWLELPCPCHPHRTVQGHGVGARSCCGHRHQDIISATPQQSGHS